MQGDALAYGDSIFENDKGVLYWFAICIKQVFGFLLLDLHRTVIARRRHLYGAVVVGSEAYRVVNCVFYFVLIIPIERFFEVLFASGQSKQCCQCNEYDAVFHSFCIVSVSSMKMQKYV